MRFSLVIPAAVILSAGPAWVMNFTPPGENIALGRPYALAPQPNYPLCKDPGDVTHLTDGVYTEGYFWTQGSTVGWMDVSRVVITVDLGEVQPVGGVSLSTAGRMGAGVFWPAAIFIYFSEDGDNWWPAGEIVSLGAEYGLPPHTSDDEGERSWPHRFRTDRVQGVARYVAFLVRGSGQFIFCDEVEVYRGDDGLLQAARTGPAVTDLAEHAVSRDRHLLSLQQVVMTEIGRVRGEVADAGLDEGRASALQARMDDLRERWQEGMSAPEMALEVLHEVYTAALAVGAEVLREQGLPPLTVWQDNPWDPLEYGAVPRGDIRAPALDVTLMRGEIRSAALNLLSVAEDIRQVRISITDMPSGPAPDWLRVREAHWTYSYEAPYAAALPDAAQGTDGFLVNTPPGQTRQVWFSIDAGRLAPGSYSGFALLHAAGEELARVPFTVRVSPVTMPARLSLSLGGWDYTDPPNVYNLPEECLQDTVRFLQEYQVDAPWASAHVMPFGVHGPDGAMLEPPDTSAMDGWLELWPDATWYCVYNGFEGRRSEMPPELDPRTEAGQRAVAEWITFWVEHLAGKGIAASRLFLLVVDEPRSPELDELMIAHARPIVAAQPDVVIWNDPIWHDPRDADPEIYALSTVLSPHRAQWLSKPDLVGGFFLGLKEQGKRLQFYSCLGPVRSLDPYSYHRLQAWDCFRHGMDAQFFWCFGGGGRMMRWRDGLGFEHTFSPQMLDAEGSTTAKNMEAIREGRYDYEYLVILRDLVDALERDGAGGGALEEARALLQEAPERVLNAPGAQKLGWAAVKDRGKADAIRLEILEMIERLRAMNAGR